MRKLFKFLTAIFFVAMIWTSLSAEIMSLKGWLSLLPGGRLYLGTGQYLSQDKTNYQIDVSSDMNLGTSARLFFGTQYFQYDSTNYRINSSTPLFATGGITIPVAVITGSITVYGTVDGRDVSTDGANLDATRVSTGTLDTNKLNLSGGTMTGSILSSGNYELSYSTVSVGQVLRLTNLASDPAAIYLATGTVWMQGYAVYISTGWTGSVPNKAKFTVTVP